MGYSTYDANQWRSYKTSGAAHQAASQMASNSNLDPAYDPRHFKIRESCDSAQNPKSTPIVVIGDATGSMGHLAHIMVQDGMSTLAAEIHRSKPVSDPHLLFGIVGDLQCDPGPFQATQFEADIRVAQQAASLWLGGCGGGGNGSESYHAAWYFGARRTRLDCVKRGAKGLLFTYGDESVPPPLTPEQITQFFGDKVETSLSAAALLEEASCFYDVFHLIVADSGYLRSESTRDNVRRKWNDLMGERAIMLTDHTKMPEVIVSLARMLAGEDRDTIVNSYSGSTQVAVINATSGLPAGRNSARTGIVRF